MNFKTLILKAKYVIQLGEEMEKLHPRLYSTGITRQISHHNDFPNAETAAVLLSAIGRELFKAGVNWSKIISLFCICGALSVDFVRQNHLDYLPKLVDAFADVIEDELTQFIYDNGKNLFYFIIKKYIKIFFFYFAGGWVSLVY